MYILYTRFPCWHHYLISFLFHPSVTFLLTFTSPFIPYSVFVCTLSSLIFLSFLDTLCSFPNTRRFYPHYLATAHRSFHAILLRPSLFVPSSLFLPSLLVVPHCPRSPPCPLPSRIRRSLQAISSALPLALAASPFRSFTHLLHNRARGCQPAPRNTL